MNQTLQSIRVGLFFILGLILIYTVYSVIGNRQIRATEGYELKLTFNDIKTLSPGSDVRMAGVRIGEVNRTGLEQGEGVVYLKIQRDIEIPSDSIASVSVASLLGQNYISILYGSSGQSVEEGDSLPTKPSYDFNDVIGEVKSLGEKFNGIAESFGGGGDGEMNNLFSNLNKLIVENQTKFDQVMTNLESITAKIDSGEGTLGKLLNDDGAYDQLISTVADIQKAAQDAQETLNSANGIFAKIDSGEGTLGKLMTDDTIAKELEASVANLKSFSEKLNSGEGTLGKLVTDDTLYRELRGMLQKADQALDSVSDSGPITAVGAASNALF